jgi:hypothetical protein
MQLKQQDVIDSKMSRPRERERERKRIVTKKPALNMTNLHVLSLTLKTLLKIEFSAGH